MKAVLFSNCSRRLCIQELAQPANRQQTYYIPVVISEANQQCVQIPRRRTSQMVAELVVNNLVQVHTPTEVHEKILSFVLSDE
jgi:hypothetical protein